MPLDASIFPDEVQVAFFIFSMLPDNWDGMSGSYMGKVWDSCEFLLNLYEVDEKKIVVFIMKMYEAILIQQKAEEAEKRRKAEERKSAGGGKNYTHNVKG